MLRWVCYQKSIAKKKIVDCNLQHGRLFIWKNIECSREMDSFYDCKAQVKWKLKAALFILGLRGDGYKTKVILIKSRPAVTLKTEMLMSHFQIQEILEVATVESQTLVYINQSWSLQIWEIFNICKVCLHWRTHLVSSD